MYLVNIFFFFFSSRRRHTRWNCDWSADVCSSDLLGVRSLTAQRTRSAAAGAMAGLATVLIAACGSSNTVTATPTGGAGPYSANPSATPQGTAHGGHGRADRAGLRHDP